MSQENKAKAPKTKVSLRRKPGGRVMKTFYVDTGTWKSVEAIAKSRNAQAKLDDGDRVSVSTVVREALRWYLESQKGSM